LATPCRGRNRTATTTARKQYSGSSWLLPLHVRIVRAAAAFGRDPDDVLRRILDVAGFAVHAVLGIDLQARLGVEVDELVHAGRAVALLRSAVFLQVDGDGNGRILEREVRRLVFAVVRIGEGEVGQPI